MSGESTQSPLINPTATVIAITVLSVIFLIALAVYLISRSRRGKEKSEELVQSGLVEMERENQFAAAAEQMPYFKDAGAAARETAILFREYLSMPVLAIYAGRE